MSTPCFLIEATDRCTRALWRGSETSGPPDCGAYHHFAYRVIGPGGKIRKHKGGTYSVPKGRWVPRSDPRWPTTCDTCGAALVKPWSRQGGDRLYRRVDTGQEYSLRDAPPGAIYRAEWYEDAWPGPDGKSYVCVTPGGAWMIDGMANNCTRPDDWKLPAGDPGRHWCWIRSGEAPRFTVNKAGRTCAAGAGSIQAGSYHGFLQNGVLT